MKTSLNLLPPGNLLGNLAVVRLCQWALVWMVLAAVLAGSYWSRRGEAQADLETLRARQRQYAPTELLEAELRKIKQQLAALRSAQLSAGSLVDDRPALTLLGAVSRSAAATQGGLWVQKLAVKPQTGGDGRRTAVTSGAGPAPTTVSLQGIAQDNLAVARFLAALRDSELFERVELKSAVEQTVGERALRSYLVECTY
jgi:Tfp pilus assembly protein PilN